MWRSNQKFNAYLTHHILKFYFELVFSPFDERKEGKEERWQASPRLLGTVPSSTIWRGCWYLGILCFPFFSSFPSVPLIRHPEKKAHMFLQVQPSTTLSGLPLSLEFLGQILLAQVSHTNVGPTQSHHHPSGRPVLMARLIQAVNTRESVNT